jgi:hypothetical protein
MCKTSSYFRISVFRNRVVAWMLLVIFVSSFAPSLSLAQQATATIRTLSGNVLVSGQVAKLGIVLSAGDTIETQAGASVVLVLSDGSELQLGEHTQVNLVDLRQTASGARVSRLKMMWGRIRAKLSPGHQQAGSSFDIETPNALVGVKFSQPDVEVSYDPAKQETIGIAHTVELIAINLLTNEKIIVPVGSSVIIVGLLMKVIAGTTAAAIAAGTTTATTGTTVATTATGIGTGTMVAIGVGVAAAAGGVAAIAASSASDGSETAESTGDLSGTWALSAQGVSQGCTEHTPCMSDPPYLCGTSVCGSFQMGDSDIQVSQTGNALSASEVDVSGHPFTLNGTINGNSVSFTIQGMGARVDGSANTTYTGVLDGNTIRGTFSGSASWDTPDGRTETPTWTGTFTVDIEKK